MSEPSAVDYYELLQISPNAEPETIHRVYRLLAQRYHPDNRDTGNVARFQTLHEAYAVLSDAAKRAQYDVAYHQERQDRWRPQTIDAKAEDPFEVEQVVRVTVLEVLYADRRAKPSSSGVFVLDLETLTGQPREHLEFTTWYLMQKQLIQRGDNSRLAITADGIDYLEQHHQTHRQQRRLKAASAAVAPAATVA